MGTETSETVQVIITSVEVAEKSLLRIAPTPSNGQFSILGEVSQGEPMDISIFDPSGRMIRHITRYRSGEALHLEDLPRGVYTVLIHGNESQRLRLILQ